MQSRTASLLGLTGVLGLLTASPASADFIAVTWDGNALRIDQVTGAATLIGYSGHPELNSMARDPMGRLLTANEANAELPHLLHVDPILGVATVFHLPFLNSIRAMAFSPAGVLYAIDSNPSATQNDLYWLDLSVAYGDSSIKHFIGTTNISGIQGMEFAADGTLYGWSVDNGLIVIDPATAQATDVNGLLDGTSSIQTIAFDPNGNLYGGGDFLYTIDRVTGAITVVGPPMIGSVRGMEYVDLAPPTPYCFGDDIGSACPCTNFGLPEHGCDNSGTTGGSLLTVSGTASLSADTLRLTTVGEMPTAFSVFWQGHAAVGPVVYGDGMRCVGVVLKRLHSENAVAGSAAYPDGLEIPIATRSAALGDPISPGSLRFYQVAYRDPSPTFCPPPMGNTFNNSEAMRIVWAP